MVSTELLESNGVNSSIPSTLTYLTRQLLSLDAIFARIFRPFFDPTSLHIPYPTFLLHVYLCHDHFLYAPYDFTLMNK